MSGDLQNTRVLITVMTYPHPSEKYDELVCTAGITEQNEWVRLYPIDYRYRPRNQQFHTYQWIEVELGPRGAGNDNRKESRKPKLDSIKIIGRPLSTKNAWRERRAIIDKLPHHTLNQLKALYDDSRVSLGLVRPTKVLDVEVAPVDEDWKPSWQSVFSQMRLFGDPPKPLRKIPYSFRYVFECEDSSKPHSALIEDWGLGVLFLKEAERLGSDEVAAQSVKQKYADLCGATKDTRFFVGTTFPFNSWVVLGVFWPPKITQPTLF